MRYTLDTVPYAREPMDAANDIDVRLTVLMWASQTTKSTTIENVAGYFIHSDPGPILLVQPTVEMAQAWSKERLGPTIRDTPALQELLSDHKSRDSGNTIQLKTFPGGNLAIIGANAPAGLAGRPRRVVLLDEVDRFPASAGTEGDPVALAIRRTESFHNSVIYLTSTPTIKGASRIESEYEQTDKRKWFVPCHVCREPQTLEWARLKWEKDQPETAYYECAKCGARWDDAMRVAAIRAGRWVATAPFNGKRGYFLSGLYSPFKAKRGFKNRLHQMAAEFLEAKRGGPEQLRVWTNTFLAETWEDEADKIEVGGLIDRCENYSPDKLPASVVVVVGGADVQKDRIEIEWIGVGRDEETWGVRVDKVFGDTEKPDTWKRLSQLIEGSVFKREDGAEIRPAALAIDFHFNGREVRAWAGRHGTRCLVFPVIGIGQAQGALVMDRWNKASRQRTWSISTDPAKDTIFARLKIDVPGSRYTHFPRGHGYEDGWFQQLTAERATVKYSRGFQRRVYEKRPGARNEALDMRVYQIAALEILRPNIEAIERGLKPAPKPEAEHTGPRDYQMRKPRRPGGGWMNGY